MAESAQATDALALDALKAIGKTLGQMTLYRVGHPAVAATLQESHRLLGQVLESSRAAELTYAIDGDKLLANGRVIASAALLPNSILSVFKRYHLHSITFKAGLQTSELTALCELAGLRPEAAKTMDAAAFLKERGVQSIQFNAAIYAKVEKGWETPQPVPVSVPAAEPTGAAAPPAAGTAPAETPAPAPVPAPAGPTIAEKIAPLPIEESIDALVKEAVKDPKDQAAVYDTVLQQLQADLEQKIKKATESLRKEKTKVENEQVRTTTVLSNMAEGVVVVDDHGNILMMNPAAEELYGVKLVDVAGKPLSDRVKEEHLMTLATEMGEVKEVPSESKVDVLSTDDTRRTVRGSTAIVQNESGKPVGMVSVLTDVTKHKELQRMERDFVAHVTHELRAPLSSIRASLEILQGQLTGKLASDDERIFGTALRNADRLEDLIRQILDFSKLESGQMTVHPRPAEAEQIAKESVDSLRPWCQKKGINLTFTAESKIPHVMSDPQRTVQVCVNLLSNAIKFTPQGGNIAVRVAPGMGKFEKFVQVSVSDTGPGIAKADQAKIFEKFVQIASGEKHVGGTGLGLAISKALIHLQGGAMWVDSEVGKGATFHFTLPINVAKGEETVAVVKTLVRRPWWKRLLGLK
ncbi:MAG: PAS domain S-box protein [Elusimicrobia bacterium]|nr:PAS domain S-box protein [Elusimicrobiota bacterium]